MIVLVLVSNNNKNVIIMARGRSPSKGIKIHHSLLLPGTKPLENLLRQSQSTTPTPWALLLATTPTEVKPTSLEVTPDLDHISI